MKKIRILSLDQGDFPFISGSFSFFVFKNRIKNIWKRHSKFRGNIDLNYREILIQGYQIHPCHIIFGGRGFQALRPPGL